MWIHQEVLNSQLVHRPPREQLRCLPRPSRGHFQLALNDSLAFAPTGENSTASPQLDEPAWPLMLLIVCKTEPEDVDDDVTRGTS